MKLISKLAYLVLLLGLAFAVVQPAVLRAADNEYAFKVHNKTGQAIKEVLVSENKKTWGKFEIGKGIGAGKTVKLVWDKSTASEGCRQWVKAVYADGEESEPAKFDFCEDDLEIEFEE